MKVILLKDVSKVGRKFDVKEVSSGHALNLLIPQGLAEAATESAVKRIEAMKAKERATKEKHEGELLGALEKVKAIDLKAKANEKGHLFATIHKADIAKQLEKKTGLSFDEETIGLEKPIKEVGEYMVEVSVGEKKTKVKVVISKE